jgi:hypothetical protein
MVEKDSAEALVKAYIRAWYDAWTSVQDRFTSKVDLEVWRGVMAGVDAAYFAFGARSSASNSYVTPAEHDPERETIVGFVSDGPDAARVETQGSSTGGSYWEYEIALAAGEPKLTRIRRHFEAKGTLVLGPEVTAGLLERPTKDAALEALPRGFDLNCDALFESGREVTQGDDTYRLEVRALGDLTTMGVLGALDFGCDVHGLSPFARRLAPGSYPAEACIADNRVAALRVCISKAPVTSWHPATFTDGSHVVGVDTANVAVFDVAAFAQLDVWKKERLFEASIDGLRPVARMMTLRSPGDAVIVGSGFGDGAYPCYWGVDAQGDIARLVVDFQMLGTFLDESCTIEWTGGPITHPLLLDWGIELAVEGKYFIARGDAFQRAVVTQGPDKFDSGRVSVRVKGAERRHDFKKELVAPLTVVVTVATGYRNG